VDVIGANADIELYPVEAAITVMVTLIEVEDPVATIPFVEDDQIGSLAGPDPVVAGTAKHGIVALTGRYLVVTVTTVEPVIALVAEQPVIAAVPAQYVIAVGALEVVVAVISVLDHPVQRRANIDLGHEDVGSAVGIARNQVGSIAGVSHEVAIRGD